MNRQCAYRSTLSDHTVSLFNGHISGQVWLINTQKQVDQTKVLDRFFEQLTQRDQTNRSSATANSIWKSLIVTKDALILKLVRIS